jgi:ferredoxin/flavodoxin---NADP+ reductase
LWTPILFSLKLDLDINPFKPGQFTNLALNINGEQVVRPYSFFSSPGVNPAEFFFYAAADEVLSKQLIKL